MNFMLQITPILMSKQQLAEQGEGYRAFRSFVSESGLLAQLA
jgi:hypothetical protein